MYVLVRTRRAEGPSYGHKVTDGKGGDAMNSRTGAREQDALPAQTEKQPMSDVPASSPWLTVTGAAGYATLSRDTIYTACERGELRHVRVAGRRAIRLRSEWIDAWLEQYARGCRTDDVAR